MLGHFQTLLEGIPEHLDRPLREVPFLTQPERHQLLVEWSGTAKENPEALCVHELFEAAAKQAPDAVALRWGDRRLTYRQLNGRANHLARYLRVQGIGPEVLVAIYLDGSSDMVVAMLGVLKAGGAYVPLDSKYPMERLAFMLKDTRAPVLLTQRSLVDCLPEHQTRVVCIDDRGFFDEDESPIDLPASTVTPANLAYVLYTSGSTGTPRASPSSTVIPLPSCAGLPMPSPRKIWPACWQRPPSVSTVRSSSCSGP